VAARQQVYTGGGILEIQPPLGIIKTKGEPAPVPCDKKSLPRESWRFQLSAIHHTSNNTFVTPTKGPSVGPLEPVSNIAGRARQVVFAHLRWSQVT